MASRPHQALIWGQAGGSLRTDSAGVWWSSMPFQRRSEYLGFLENQTEIEADWDTTYGDRKNEIVFIGQDSDEKAIRSDLDQCLSTAVELSSEKWHKGYDDTWPVERAYALD